MISAAVDTNGGSVRDDTGRVIKPINSIGFPARPGPFRGRRSVPSAVMLTAGGPRRELVPGTEPPTDPHPDGRPGRDVPPVRGRSRHRIRCPQHRRRSRGLLGAAAGRCGPSGCCSLCITARRYHWSPSSGRGRPERAAPGPARRAPCVQHRFRRLRRGREPGPAGRRPTRAWRHRGGVLPRRRRDGARLPCGNRRGRVFGEYRAFKSPGYAAGPIIGVPRITSGGIPCSSPTSPHGPAGHRLSRPRRPLRGTARPAPANRPRPRKATRLSELPATHDHPGRRHRRPGNRSGMSVGMGMAALGMLAGAVRPGILVAAVLIGAGTGLADSVAFAHLAGTTPAERLGQTMRAAEVGRNSVIRWPAPRRRGRRRPDPEPGTRRTRLRPHHHRRRRPGPPNQHQLAETLTPRGPTGSCSVQGSPIDAEYMSGPGTIGGLADTGLGTFHRPTQFSTMEVAIRVAGCPRSMVGFGRPAGAAGRDGAYRRYQVVGAAALED